MKVTLHTWKRARQSFWLYNLVPWARWIMVSSESFEYIYSFFFHPKTTINYPVFWHHTNPHLRSKHVYCCLLWHLCPFIVVKLNQFMVILHKVHFACGYNAALHACFVIILGLEAWKSFHPNNFICLHNCVIRLCSGYRISCQSANILPSNVQFWC
jgi:hypothetical protein